MNGVSSWAEAHNSGLPGRRLPPECQESVMPKLNLGVFLHELVTEGLHISATRGRLAFRPSIAHIQRRYCILRPYRHFLWMRVLRPSSGFPRTFTPHLPVLPLSCFTRL
jgi:hypothetical protein